MFIVQSNLEYYKILRPTYIVGEKNHNPRLGHYIKAIKDNIPIEVAGNGDNIINLVFAEDVINCITSIIYNDPYLNTYSPIEYNVSSDEFFPSCKSRLSPYLILYRFTNGSKTSIALSYIGVQYHSIPIFPAIELISSILFSEMHVLSNLSFSGWSLTID